jgi:hypothetical protein
MPASKVLDFLKNSPQKIYFSANNFTGKHYGRVGHGMTIMMIMLQKLRHYQFMAM